MDRFDRVPADVRQRRFDDLAAMVCLLGRPVPERRAEAVHHGRDPVIAERLAQRLAGEPRSPLAGEHERTPAVAERTGRLEDLQRAPAQGHTMVALQLHARGRNGPHAAGRVDLVPRRQPDLAVARRRQHQKLERELHDRRRRRGADGRHSRGDLAVRQRLHVLHDLALGAQHPADPVTRVVAAELHGHGPLQHRGDPLPDHLGGRRLRVPDGGARGPEQDRGGQHAAVRPRTNRRANGRPTGRHSGGGVGEDIVGKGQSGRACAVSTRARCRPDDAAGDRSIMRSPRATCCHRHRGQRGTVRLTLRAARCRDANASIPLPSASLSA